MPNPQSGRGFSLERAAASRPSLGLVPAIVSSFATEYRRGWVVVQLAPGVILMHIHTFTQYHCKEPD